MIRPVIAEDLGQALRNGLWQLNFMNAEVCNIKQSDGVLGECQDIKAPIIAEKWEQRLEVEMGADDDKLLKTEWQPVGVEYVLGAKERQPLARMEPERFIGYQCLDRLKQVLHLCSMHIGQKQEVLSLSRLILESDPVLLYFWSYLVGGQIQRDAWLTMFLHEHFEVPFGSCVHPLHSFVAPSAKLSPKGRVCTTRSGRFVDPRTCSVTLPSASRCRPPRPWVAIAIRSQLPNIAVPSASLPVSATLRRALATSFPIATEQTMVSLSSASGPLRRRSATSLRYVFASQRTSSFIKGSMRSCSFAGRSTTRVSRSMPRVGAASAATSFAAGSSTASAPTEPSSATNPISARRGRVGSGNELVGISPFSLRTRTGSGL